MIEGVILVKSNNAFVPIERIYVVNTFMNFTVPWKSERSEWAGQWMEQASKAERCGISEWSEVTNVASDQVAR